MAYSRFSRVLYLSRIVECATCGSFPRIYASITSACFNCILCYRIYLYPRRSNFCVSSPPPYLPSRSEAQYPSQVIYAHPMISVFPPRVKHVPPASVLSLLLSRFCSTIVFVGDVVVRARERPRSKICDLSFDDRRRLSPFLPGKLSLRIFRESDPIDK